MVNALNHTQPYLLTDNVWFPAADGAQLYDTEARNNPGVNSYCSPSSTLRTGSRGSQLVCIIDSIAGCLLRAALAPPVHKYASVRGRATRGVSEAGLPQGMLRQPSCQCCADAGASRFATGRKEHGSGDAPRCLPCETGDRIRRAVEDRGGAAGDTGFAPPLVRSPIAACVAVLTFVSRACFAAHSAQYAAAGLGQGRAHTLSSAKGHAAHDIAYSPLYSLTV